MTQECRSIHTILGTARLCVGASAMKQVSVFMSHIPFHPALQYCFFNMNLHLNFKVVVCDVFVFA